MVERSARKASRLVKDGPATLGHLKVAAHRANRRGARRACQQLRRGAGQDDVTFDTCRVTGRDVA